MIEASRYICIFIAIFFVSSHLLLQFVVCVWKWETNHEIQMRHTQVGAKQNWGGEGIKRWKMTKQGGARPQKSWGPPQTWNSGYANPFLDMLKRATFFLVHTEEFCYLWAQSKTWALKQNLRHSLIFVMALLPWIILWYIHGQSFENHQTND